MRMVLAQSNPGPIVAAGKKIDRVVDISKSFPSFIWRTSGSHQIWLATLSAIVFGLTAAPLDIQRRVVNDAFKGGQFSTIFLTRRDLSGSFPGVGPDQARPQCLQEPGRRERGPRSAHEHRSENQDRHHSAESGGGRGRGNVSRRCRVGAGWAIRRQRGFRADAARWDTPQHIGLHDLSAAAHGPTRSWCSLASVRLRAVDAARHQ